MVTDQEYVYRNGVLHCEGKNLKEIADTHGTPSYVYSRRIIERNYLDYEEALKGIPHQICYAVKANSNLAVLQILARLGAGFDIVSGGELFSVLESGANRIGWFFPGSVKPQQKSVTPWKREFIVSTVNRKGNCTWFQNWLLAGA